MFQKTVKRVRIKNPKVSVAIATKQWMDSVVEVKRAIACSYPTSAIQAAVATCIEKGIVCDATEYERREAIGGALIRTGWHNDRNNKVSRLADLISLRNVSLDIESDTPCIKFKVHAKLEDGAEYLSEEALEWLNSDGEIVTQNRHLYVNVAPFVEAARSLDTYMTDVEQEVYRRLDIMAHELRLRERVARNYVNTQPAPLSAAGPEVIAALARGGIIKNYNGQHVGIRNAAGVKTFLQHLLNAEGLIDGTVFVVLHEPSGRAAVIKERNLEYGDPVWVDARTATQALVEFERRAG